MVNLVKIKTSNTIALLQTITAVLMLTSCGTTYVIGKPPQSPQEFIIAAENSSSPDERILNMGFDQAVERLKQVSKQCYQFNVITNVNGGESHRDKMTSKVTMLSPSSAAFTMQDKRISGAKVVYTSGHELKDGLYNYAIVVDKTSKNTTKAKLYYSIYFYDEIVNTILDTVEGKFGSDCPPEDDRMLGHS